MTDEADRALDGFRSDIQEVIEKHWGSIGPMGRLDDSVDDLEAAEIEQEMGITYCSGWVLILGSASIENSDGPAMSMRVAPRGQSPFLGIGLVHDQLQTWVG